MIEQYESFNSAEDDVENNCKSLIEKYRKIEENFELDSEFELKLNENDNETCKTEQQR